MLYQRVLWHAASLYDQMLSSWVGEQAAPMAPLWGGTRRRSPLARFHRQPVAQYATLLPMPRLD